MSTKETIKTFDPKLNSADNQRIDLILHYFKHLSEDAKIKVYQVILRYIGLEMLRNGPEYREKLERALKEANL